MTDRTALMTAALSAIPLTALAAYTTSQLREAAREAEPRLMKQMTEDGPFMTPEQAREWIDRVRALNNISAEVLRREVVEIAAGPHLVTHEDGFRTLSSGVMCF